MLIHLLHRLLLLLAILGLVGVGDLAQKALQQYRLLSVRVEVPPPELSAQFVHLHCAHLLLRQLNARRPRILRLLLDLQVRSLQSSRRSLLGWAGARFLCSSGLLDQ